MKFYKSIIIIVSLVFFIICATFILSNAKNISQHTKDNISYTTSIQKINNKEYVKKINFEYSTMHYKNETFLIFAQKNYLDISFINILTTSEIEIKLIDVLGKVVYENNIRNIQFKKDRVSGLKVGEYKLEVFLRKGSGKGCIEIE